MTSNAATVPATATKVRALVGTEKVAAIAVTRNGNYYQYWPKDGSNKYFDDVESWMEACKSAHDGVTFHVVEGAHGPRCPGQSPAGEHPHVAYVRSLYDVYGVSNTLKTAFPAESRRQGRFNVFAEDDEGTIRPVLFNRTTGALAWGGRCETVKTLLPHFPTMPERWYIQSRTSVYTGNTVLTRPFAYIPPAAAAAAAPDIYLYEFNRYIGKSPLKQYEKDLTALGYRVIVVPYDSYLPGAWWQNNRNPIPLLSITLTNGNEWCLQTRDDTQYANVAAWHAAQ
jgi:hypothetical protein